MADNVGYTPGTGAVVAADEIGGVLYQRVKPVIGADGTAVDVSATNPLPITIQSTANPVDVNVLGTPSVFVDGAVNVTGSTVDANITNTSVPVAPATGAVFSMQAVGELIECLEAMRQYQVSLNRTIGMLMPDTSGRLRILLDAISANLTLGTVSVVSTVQNSNLFASQPAGEVVYGALHVGADSLRRNITVS